MKKFWVVFAFTIIFAACSNQATDNTTVELNPVETFTEADAPTEFQCDSLTFTGPWGYDKHENADRKYPLVVAGCWGEGVSEYAKYNKEYPAFVLEYQKSREADGQELGEWIKAAVDSGYRIDTNRLYLTGFSRGGSGSYPLAKGLYKLGLYFAAIMRVAGQSQADLGNDIAAKTSVWYHIGTNDVPKRVEIAREALEYNRNYTCNANATEEAIADSMGGFERNNVRIYRDKHPVFIYSVYTDMGHTPEPCYQDENIFPWMFSNSLTLR